MNELVIGLVTGFLAGVALEKAAKGKILQAIANKILVIIGNGNGKK